jgi:hypothetical protein
VMLWRANRACFLLHNAGKRTANACAPISVRGSSQFWGMRSRRWRCSAPERIMAPRNRRTAKK